MVTLTLPQLFEVDAFARGANALATTMAAPARVRTKIDDAARYRLLTSPGSALAARLLFTITWRSGSPTRRRTARDDARVYVR